MKICRALLLLLLLSLGSALFFSVTPTQAQSKSVIVPRRDIDITVQKNGDVQFNETWRVDFIGGLSQMPS